MELEQSKAEHKAVLVTVNGTVIEVPKGKIQVSELKLLAGVPQAQELAQVREGKIVPLADTAELKLKGGEEFVSYPRDAASS